MDGEAYEQIRHLMPAAVRWTAVALHALLAIGIPASFAYIFLRSATRSVRGFDRSEWAERARRIYPYRYGLGMILAIAAIGPLYTWWTSGGVLDAWSAGVLAVLAFGTVLTLFAGAAAFHDGPPPRIRVSLRSGAFLWLVFFPGLLVALILSFLFPATLEGWAVVAATTGLLLYFGAAAGGGFLLARALGVVRPAGPRLTGIMKEIAERTGSPLRGVYEADSTMVNALVLPTLRCVIFTRRALEVLDDEELAAIGGHEMSHLRESRTITVSRLAGQVFFLPLAFWNPIFHAFGWIGLLVGFGAGGVLLWLTHSVAHRMEKRADAAAVEDETDATVYACALEKLYRTNLLPAVMPGKGGVHGHLYDRMLAVGVEPSFERPPPPAGRSIWFATIAVMLATLLLPQYLPPLLGPLSANRWWRVAMQDADADTYAMLGYRTSLERSPGEAIPLFVVAAHESWPDPEFAIVVAGLRLESGDLDGARGALREAHHRMGHWGEDEGCARRIEELERRLE